MKHLTLTSAAVGLIAAAAIAIPAAGIASAAAPATPSDTTPVITTTANFHLNAAKAKADAAIQHRLVSIGAMKVGLSRLHQPACQSATMTSELTADRNGLVALKTQIDALPTGTTGAQFKALALQITQNYRVYMLESPKAHVVAACTVVYRDAARLDAAAAHILAKNPSADVSVIKADAQAARDAAKAAVSSVIGLVADKGNASVATSNRTALQGARTDLQHAAASLKAGVAAAKAFKV